jgi:hypothetical protein
VASSSNLAATALLGNLHGRQPRTGAIRRYLLRQESARIVRKISPEDTGEATRMRCVTPDALS